MRIIGSILVLGVFAMISTMAQSAGRIVKLDPALDAIVTETAAIEKVAGGFGFAEGPVWSRDGVLLFSDIPGNAIHRLRGTDVSVLRAPMFEGKTLFLTARTSVYRVRLQASGRLP